MKTRLLSLSLIMTVVILLAIPVLHAANPAPVPAHSVVAPDSIPVLCYHRILIKPTSPYDHTPQQLEEQLNYLKSNGYHPITAIRLLEARKNPSLLPVKPIVLSFDDGHPSHYTQVFPLLEKYHFVATFFVYPVGIADSSDGRLTWAELKEMSQAGMDIESHTIDHPFLTQHQSGQKEAHYQQWLEYELKDSRQIISEKLNRPVTMLAYPYGWFNQVTEDAAVKAGYQGIFTTNWGNVDLKTNPLRINRRVMENSFDLKKFEQIVTMKALHLQIIGPVDNSILTQVPAIQFKLADPGLSQVEVIVRSQHVKLDPDLKGVYYYNPIGELKPGYCMIIIKAYDAGQHLYEGSWGFDYEPVRSEPQTTPKAETNHEPKPSPVPTVSAK